MEIFHHPKYVNAVLRAPADRPEVVDLPIHRTEVDLGDGVAPHIVESFWKPTPEELAQLNANGCVVLTVWGITMAPVYLGVVDEEQS